MKSMQKKVKFSNGQIDERMLERTDLDVLDSSASLISNLISTPYGGLKTRFGTRFIDEVGSTLKVNDPSSITNATEIGGNVSDLVNPDVDFTSNGLGTLDGTAFTYQVASYSFTGDLLYITRSSVEYKNIYLLVEDAEITLTQLSGLIVGYTIVNGGFGINNEVLTVNDPTGTGAILTATTNDAGTITSISIDNPGTDYTSPVLSIASDDISVQIDPAIGLLGGGSKNLESVTIDKNPKTIITDLSSQPSAAVSIFLNATDQTIPKTKIVMSEMIVYSEDEDSSTSRYQAKLVPFVFNEDQKYLFVLKEGVIDIYQDGSKIETLPVEGLKGDYLQSIKYAQSEDTLVLTHPSLQPIQIQRTGIGEFLSIVPIFNSGETSKDGFTVSADGEGEYKAVDGDTSTYYSEGDYSVRQGLFAGISNTYDNVLSDSYTLMFDAATTTSKISIPIEYAKSIKVYGLNGASETLIHEDNANTVEKRTIIIDTNASYDGIRIDTTAFKRIYFPGEFDYFIPPVPQKYYTRNPETTITQWYATRIYNISIFTTSSSLFTAGNLQLKGTPYYQFGVDNEELKSIGITPSTTEGGLSITADSAVFDEDYVGQIIDGGGGRFKVTEYQSSTKVFGYTIIPFYTTDKIEDWTYVSGFELTWSEDRGYPKTCMFYQQRLWFGGSLSRPNTLWASRVSQYNSFENTGNYANDSIEATLQSNTVDGIVNIYPNRGVQIFTRGAEYVASETTLTPNDITIIKNTANGSLDQVSPVDVSGTTLFIEKNGKSLLSFVYAEGENAYVTSNLSLLSNLIDSPIAMAFDYNSSRTDGNYLYVVNNKGNLVTGCILLDQKINSYVTGETDGLYQDVAIVGEETYFLVQRGEKLYLELSVSDKTDSSSVSDSGSLVITDLAHLEDKEVYAYTTDVDYGTYTVENGQITLTGDVPETDVFVGLGFQYKLESNPISVGGQSRNIEKRISRAVVSTLDTAEITMNGSKRVATNDRFNFYGVTRQDRDVRYTINGEYNPIEILSVVLYINYGAK